MEESQLTSNSHLDFLFITTQMAGHYFVMMANGKNEQKHTADGANMERSEMEGGETERGAGQCAATSMPICRQNHRRESSPVWRW